MAAMVSENRRNSKDSPRVEGGVRSRQSRTLGHRLLTAALALVTAVGTPGCFLGLSSNPFRLGYLHPGDIVRTHAKPPAWGYNRNFDPAARQVSINHKEVVCKVRTQAVLVAAVCDKDGDGRRNRRVEWHAAGSGHMVEVDESGLFPGRGYLVDDKYGVSYTNYRTMKLTRGNENPADDVDVLPGQTYAVFTSAEEGDTFVTAYAPGVHDWDKHKAFSIIHWVDAEAVFPVPATNPIGVSHPIVTKVFRASDKTAMTGYLVRYRVVDGPPCVLLPSGSTVQDVTSDSLGNATAVLKPTSLQTGVTRVAIEVIRPMMGRAGKEIVVTSGLFEKTWIAPNIQITKNGPAAAIVGQEIPYRINVANYGDVASAGVTVRESIPPSVQILKFNPPPTRRETMAEGENLIWELGRLERGEGRFIDLVLVATQTGRLLNQVEAAAAEGLSARAATTTEVVRAGLVVTKECPPTGQVGRPVPFNIVISNPGAAPATNVRVIDDWDPAFVRPGLPGNRFEENIGTIPPGESRQLTMQLVPQQPGRWSNRIAVVADGNLSARAAATCEVDQAKLSITKTVDRPNLFVGNECTFTIRVANGSKVPLTGLQINDQLPGELDPLEASFPGRINGSAVFWELGTLNPGDAKTVTLRARANRAGSQRVVNVAVATAEGISQKAEAAVSIDGIPGLQTELIDQPDDPVRIGGQVRYRMRITNQGTAMFRKIDVACEVPGNLEIIGVAPETLRPRWDGKSATFAIGELEPGGRLDLEVLCLAKREGRPIFKMRVKADDLPETLKEESTQVYDPATGKLTLIRPDGESMVPVDSREPAGAQGAGDAGGNGARPHPGDSNRRTEARPDGGVVLPGLDLPSASAGDDPDASSSVKRSAGDHEVSLEEVILPPIEVVAGGDDPTEAPSPPANGVTPSGSANARPSPSPKQPEATSSTEPKATPKGATAARPSASGAEGLDLPDDLIPAPPAAKEPGGSPAVPTNAPAEPSRGDGAKAKAGSSSDSTMPPAESGRKPATTPAPADRPAPAPPRLRLPG
jgi:uncharacterized repeat protein (TIGR01451 family)